MVWQVIIWRLPRSSGNRQQRWRLQLRIKRLTRQNNAQSPSEWKNNAISRGFFLFLGSVYLARYTNYFLDFPEFQRLFTQYLSQEIQLRYFQESKKQQTKPNKPTTSKPSRVAFLLSNLRTVFLIHTFPRWPPIMLTEKQLAAALSVSVRTIQNWKKSGIIHENEVKRIGGRVRIHPSALLRLAGEVVSVSETNLFNTQQNSKLKKRLGI